MVRLSFTIYVRSMGIETMTFALFPNYFTRL